MKASGLNVTVEGDVSDFLGVKVTKEKDGTIHLTQPHLIDQILQDLLRLHKDNVATKQTPAAVSTILSRHSTSEPCDGHF